MAVESAENSGSAANDSYDAALTEGAVGVSPSGARRNLSMNTPDVPSGRPLTILRICRPGARTHLTSAVLVRLDGVAGAITDRARDSGR